MSVRVATTANITLDNTTTTVDGVTLANGDLILVKNQTTGTQNGVYVVSTSGAWSRSSLLPVAANAYRTTYIVTSGTANGLLNFKCVITPAIVGTNSLVFAAFDNALLNNLSATTNPAVTDDNTKGYSVGSVWINTTGNTVYTCTNNGTGVAVWTQGGTGDVVGPASSTANALPRFSGTTGKLIKDSSVTLSDTSDLAGVKTLALSGSTSGALTVQPGATTTSYTITMPSAQGAANSFLQNNGSGTISWGDTAPKATNLTGATTDTVPYQSASATTSYYTYNQLNGALANASATQTIYLSNLNGSDTYNGLSPQTSVATLGKALTLVQSGGIIKVNRSGTAYSESVSITAQNITIMSDAYNGSVAFSGTITVANTASNVSMKGLSIATLVHSGAGALYMFNCTVTTAFTSTNSGYLLAQDSDFQGSGATTVGITGTGTKIFGTNCYLGAVTINNASALVGIYNINNSLAITLTAGILSVNNGVVYAATAGANALSVASSAVAYLENVNFTVLGTTNAALINVSAGGFYSEINVVRSASSTISGTNLPRTPYNDALNSFAVGLRGSTSGLLTIKPAATTTSYTLTMPSAQGAATTVLQNDGSGGLSWATVTSGSSSSLVYGYYNGSGSVDASNRVIFNSTAVINTDTSQISMSGNVVTLATGTWELRGIVQSNTSSSGDFRFYNETTSAYVGQLLNNSGSTGFSSGNVNTYTVTLASSTNFSFRFVVGGTANPNASYTYLIVEKKSSTPINPAPEYMVANLSTNQTTNVSSGDHIKFNGLWNGNMSSTGTTTTTNISLDTSTAYVTTNNVASIGRFTLAAARTYELTASLAATSGSGGFAWYNADTGTQLSNEAKLLDNLQCIAKAIVTPASNTRYEVRLTQTGPTTFHSSAAFAEVRIIGALPNGSNFSGATQSGPGSQGLVPAPAAAQQNYFLQGDGTWEPGVYTQTTVQRAASTPVTGLPFFNTTNRQLEYYNGTNYLTSSTVTITTTGQTGSLTDNLVIFNPPSSTALTYTLPDPTVTYGKVITYRISSGATAKNSTVTLSAPGGATVNGAASFILACVGDFVTLTSNGTDWVVTNKPTGLLLIEDRTVSSQTNVTFDNVFAASKYNAYVIDVYLTNSGGSGGFSNRWALRNGGATITTSTYQTSGRYQGPFAADIQVNNQVAWYDANFFNWSGAGDFMSITAEIRYPQSSTNLTTFQGQGTYSLASASNYLTAAIYTTTFGCEFRTIATTADGWIYLGQSGTVSGNIKVYARCV